MTCFFWAEGTCKVDAEACGFAHEERPIVAPPPPNYVPSGKALPNLSNFKYLTVWQVLDANPRRVWSYQSKIPYLNGLHPQQRVPMVN